MSAPIGAGPFTERFGQALAYAERLHRAQVRKGSNVAYIAHLIAVASLAIEHGAKEDEAIAALLHDSIEDQAGSDPAPLMNEIRGQFGEHVLSVVMGCSDSDTSINKPPWRERKERYVGHIATAPRSVLLVSCADKCHNARSILADLLSDGPSVWDRFTGGRDGSLWYYRAIADAFEARVPDVPAGLARLLAVTVAEIERVSAE
ncbi:MAG: HD domain-containing protein [Burkholderiaceae bacterium]